MIKSLDHLLTQKRNPTKILPRSLVTLSRKFLVKELAWYVNSPENFDDPEKGRIEELYDREGITPKHAPLVSLDELYLLQGWPDAIVDMVLESFTVHENHSIPINEIVQSQLEALFPELDLEQIDQFFKYRDGNPEDEWDPTPFQSVSHFKNFLVDDLGVSEELYDQRAEELERGKMKFGVVGKLYKIVSRGSFNRVNYTLTAFVEIPVEPPKKEPKPPPGKRAPRKKGGPPKSSKKEETEILLPPKIVEIYIQ